MATDEELRNHAAAVEGHIAEVRKRIFSICRELERRAIRHDHSKLSPPERDVFAEVTPRLKDTTFGSEDYNQLLTEMDPALNHHYKVNRHHPEYFENGIKGMTLVDLIEMVCDWEAATLRHADGDIMKSIPKCAKRFGICDQLVQILKNTCKTPPG